MLPLIWFLARASSSARKPVARDACELGADDVDDLAHPLGAGADVDAEVAGVADSEDRNE